jgi:hypothetical protein
MQVFWFFLNVATAFDMPIINYAYLLSQVSPLVSNNTGPMHISYAVNTPTIGIFQHAGNGRPDLVGPFKLDKIFFPVVNSLNGTTSAEEVWVRFMPSTRHRNNAKNLTFKRINRKHAERNSESLSKKRNRPLLAGLGTALAAHTNAYRFCGTNQLRIEWNLTHYSRQRL